MENLVITDYLATNRLYYECLRSFLTTESIRNQRMYTTVSNFLQRRQNRTSETSFTTARPLRRTRNQTTSTSRSTTNRRVLSNILNNVNIYKYSDISTNCLICPISRENFLNDDIIIQINHCEHIFKCKYLLRWFETHTTCPTCRHNILHQINNPLPVVNNLLPVVNNPLPVVNNPATTITPIFSTIADSFFNNSYS